VAISACAQSVFANESCGARRAIPSTESTAGSPASERSRLVPTLPVAPAMTTLIRAFMDEAAGVKGGLSRNRPTMGELDGVWTVRRTGGLLPPLIGVRKRIRGNRGTTSVGPLPGFPFTVVGSSLQYLPPLSGFVDVLERDAVDRYRGRATFRGRDFGTFTMERRR
jgi:hypothetical protein